jgi:hypothetical protein
MVRFWCGFGATKKSTFLALWNTTLLPLLQTREPFCHARQNSLRRGQLLPELRKEALLLENTTGTLRKWSISIFADVLSEALLTLISLRNIQRHLALKASLLFRCPFYTVVGIAEVKHCPDGTYITRTRNASWILRTCADSAKKRIS